MNTVQYKCPYCGGELTFKPEEQKFGCDYCDSYFEEAEIAKMYDEVNRMAEENADPDAQTLESENDYSQFEDSEFTEQTRLYSCNSCGAEIIAEETSAATFCYYCHNPVVLAGRLTGEYRPNYVIPFAYTREKALEGFKTWCKSKWFLPKDFKSEQQLEKMSGVYVPFWLTSCTANASLSCIGERKRSWTSGSYRITEIREYAVKRSGSFPFQRVPSDGAKKIEDALMDAIEPYHYKDIRDFSMQYLSGFLAEKYDVTWEDSVGRVKERIKEGCSQKLRESVTGYSGVKAVNVNVGYKGVAKEYALMPVWFMNYHYKGKTYSFAMNGQTGKLAGTPPLDMNKLLIACSGLFLTVTTIATLIGGFLQ